jgi:phosphoribosylaminoimidazolecarboxamide formyltransferase/IMP cyclohydrolase
LIFASKVCKTQNLTRSFCKNGTLSSGTGQTSRVDALLQAIEKQNFGFDLNGASASDAFPFPDCVAIAKEAGITAVIQPGGSIKDQLSIDYCRINLQWYLLERNINLFNFVFNF